ncbi:MAG: PIG-L family deacetylase [Bacteroidia bacterium]|nr:PIG-L family deacetylase [Bacteroidia bacterium]
MNNKVLIIAPHPDDEVLGCGAIIKRFTEQGNTVYILIVTRGSAKMYSDDGIAKVRKQALQAHALLGVKETIFFDYPAPELDVISKAAISSSISELITRLKIEILFIPHRGDIHHDHHIVFNAALVAARPVGNYTIKTIYAYETLSETEWAAPYTNDAFIPNHFVNIERYMPYKLEAMSYYTGQLRVFPNPRSIEAIEALAKFRGATVGLNRAEAFMTIRTIE